MAGANGSQRPYVVELTGFARSQLRAITRHALYAGHGDAVVVAFQEMLTRLRTDPRSAGEPGYHLHKMRMEVRKLAVRPLYIEYGVHDQRPLVVIRHVASLSELPDE